MKKFLLGLSVGIFLVAAILGGAVSDRLWGYKILDRWWPRSSEQSVVEQRVLHEESVVIDVVNQVGPSVVTVGIKKTQRLFDNFKFFDPFGFFQQPEEIKEEEVIEQDIGTGFIVSSDGLVVTNKHVVADSQAEYKVITNDDQEYQVSKVYRDPVNDLAILKINPSMSSELKPAVLGDSSQLKVGQFVIAIGTALGEFRQTVTTGVISGLGRGIEAGDPFGGDVERLDNVIQTDAAINPGNSGGPLLNSSGQVIGVSVAISQAGENIGFAIPINVIKESLANFNATGQFNRPFLGVRYKMIGRDLALLNEVPEGAYIVEVVEGSAAAKAGLAVGDIIIKMDGQALKEDNGGLAGIISRKKINETVAMEIWREGETKKLEAKLQEE